MIHGRVADIVFVHQIDDGGNGFRILGGVAVDFDVEDVPAAREVVVGRFNLRLVRCGAFVIHGNVVGVRVIFAIRNAGNFSESFLVDARKASGKSFRRRGEHGVIVFVKIRVAVRAIAHVRDDAQAEILRALIFAVMLADERDEAFRQSDEADPERALINHGFDRIVRRERVRADPERGHQQRELLRDRRFLEFETFVQLLRRDVEHGVQFFEKVRDAFFLVGDVAAFERETHEVNRRERKVPAPDGSFFAETIFKNARAAAHRRRLVEIALRIVGAPFFVMIERGVEVDEIREKAVRGNFAREHVKIVVAVGGQVAHAAFFLPNLNRENRGRAVPDAAVRREQNFANDAATFCRRVRAVVDRAENDLVPAAGMDRVHVVHKRFHRLMHALDRAVDGVLHEPLVAFESGQRAGEIIFDFRVAEVRKIFAFERFQLLHFFDVAPTHERREIKVKRRDRLPAVHFVLRGFHRNTSENARRLDAFRRTGFAVPGNHAAAQNFVQRVLHAGQRLRRIVVLVVNVNVAFAHGVFDFGREQIIVHERLRRFAGKFHHHSRRRIRVHVRVLARDVVRFRFDDFEENVARFRLARHVALFAVGDVFAGNVLALGLHQLVFDEILNRFDGHRFVPVVGDALRNLRRERDVFAQLRLEHRLLNGGDNFVRVKSDLAAVAFDDCEDHGLLSFFICS